MKKIVYTILCLGFLLFSSNVWAEFTIDVTPEDGSAELNLTPFRAVKPGDEMTVTLKVKVTSDLGEAYVLKQKMIAFLQDEQSVPLDRDAVIFHSIGDSTGGSLLVEDPVPLNVNTEYTLYSASAAGDSDEFTIVYSLTGDGLNNPGEFRGQIRYSIVSESSEDEEVIFVKANVEKGELTVAVSTSSHSANRLKLFEEDKEIKGYIKIQISGSGEDYHLCQLIEGDLKNEKGETISLEKIKFAVTSEEGESDYNSYTSLPRRRQCIYSSDSVGKDDIVVIDFAIDKEDLPSLFNGYFTGSLLYSIESLQRGTLKNIPIQIELEIKPVFEIKASSQFGGLSFYNLEPLQSVEKEVIIKVESNLGKPYYVVQKLNMPLTNKEGDVIPVSALSWEGQVSKDSPGEISSSQFTPVELGDREVFLSDDNGSSCEFKIKYKLDVPRDVKGGDYYTNLTYSLLEK